MDCGKVYIKMCDCPLIQEQWEPSYGDLVINNDSEEGKRRVIVIAYMPDEALWFVGYKRNQLVGFKKDCIWLPRQDQIQEMCVWEEPERVHQWLMKFFYFLVLELMCQNSLLLNNSGLPFICTKHTI